MLDGYVSCVTVRCGGFSRQSVRSRGSDPNLRRLATTSPGRIDASFVDAGIGDLALVFAVDCIHCREQVGDSVERIGEEEAVALREHLRTCPRATRAENVASMGELLKHFHLTRDD
ncbi:MAG: hypothetical protein HY271_01155 [Deltaproteobacteria bacterium]|nr:hypothetical protein [Deltaproteobacteria bacterium]